MLNPILLDWWSYCRAYALRPLASVAFLLLGGCSIVGTTSIDQGRTPYNEVIQSTAVEQTLLNILRVQNNEAPLFMDVTEVDAAATFTGSITGGASSIGATGNPKTSAGFFGGTLGAISGTSAYQEAPTVRYQPLTGQPLIAQIGTPLTPTSLSNFLNQGPIVAAVLTLSLTRMTHGYLDHYAALNALIALDNYGAVTFAATKSSAQEKEEEKSKTKGSATASNPPDSLTIYFESQQVDRTGASCDFTERRDGAKALWRRLLAIYNVTGNAITLTTRGFSAVPGQSVQAPTLFPRTAYEIMKAATLVGSNFSIEPVEQVRDRIDKKIQAKCDNNNNFYIIVPADAPSVARDEINRMQAKRLFPGTLYPDKTVLSHTEIKNEEVLGHSRVFMLIAESNDRPAGAYVSVRYKGQWYSILDNDMISKRSLTLIAGLNTVQAVPSTTPPLTPSISVGAR